MIRCPSCGKESPPEFRFCGYFSTALTTAATALPVHEVRKTVTIIFSDLKSSTALGETLDNEAMHEVKERYFDEIWWVYSGPAQPGVPVVRGNRRQPRHRKQFEHCLGGTAQLGAEFGDHNRPIDNVFLFHGSTLFESWNCPDRIPCEDGWIDSHARPIRSAGCRTSRLRIQAPCILSRFYSKGRDGTVKEEARRQEDHFYQAGQKDGKRQKAAQV